MAESLKFEVTSEYDGVKAGRYLRTVCNLSARTLSVLKRTDGGITRNGTLLRTVDYLKTGDVITVNLPSEENKIQPVPGELDILYEDNFLLIINKPAGMPVHPVKKHQTDTLANIIAYRYTGNGSDFVFRAVNRLDSDTSGIVIIAKDRHTASLMQNSDVIKHYYAVCHGSLNESGTIDEPMCLSGDSKIRRVVSSDGKSAVTHYKIINSFKDGALVDLLLETGRTHQIRCHMSYIGNPLYGDDIYGGSKDLISRQALHCYSVSFLHPITNDDIFVETKIPDDMNKLIQTLINNDY